MAPEAAQAKAQERSVTRLPGRDALDPEEASRPGFERFIFISRHKELVLWLVEHDKDPDNIPPSIKFAHQRFGTSNPRLCKVLCRLPDFGRLFYSQEDAVRILREENRKMRRVSLLSDDLYKMEVSGRIPDLHREVPGDHVDLPKPIEDGA